MPRKKHWLARLILWSGVTERQTCCVLCKVTMTVAAGQFALFASRDWNAAGLIMAGGIALDICREVIDRMLGRPTASAIWDANIWTTNAAFMRRQRILSYSFISLVFVSLQIVAMYFSLDRVPAQREIDVGVANSIARQVLDLSTLLRSTPDLADTRDLRSPDRAVIIVRSLSVLLVVITLFIFIGILAIARPIAILRVRLRNHRCAIRRSSKLPMATWIIASETSRRFS